MSDENNSSDLELNEQELGEHVAGDAGNVASLTKSKKIADTSKIDAMLGQIDPDFLKNLEGLAQDVRDEVEKSKIEVSPLPQIPIESPSKFYFFKKIWNKPILKYSLLGFGLAIVLPVFIYFIYQQVAAVFSLPYKNNLMEYATEIYTFPEDDELVLLFDEYKRPFFNLSLPELTVNLASLPGGLPSYGQITIQIETQSQKNLDILKVRQAELVDIANRVFQKVTWHDLSTTAGKLQTKKNLVLTMNKVLGSDLVSEVYYYSFFTKK